MGLGVDTTPQPLYPRERHPVLIAWEAGWAPGPVCTGADNLNPTGIRSPDRPARSESLYRLSHPGPRREVTALILCETLKVWVYKRLCRLTLEAQAWKTAFWRFLCRRRIKCRLNFSTCATSLVKVRHNPPFYYTWKDTKTKQICLKCRLR